MSSLRFIYTIFLAALFVLLSYLYFFHKIEYESFSLFFLLAAPLAYYYPSYRSITVIFAEVPSGNHPQRQTVGRELVAVFAKNLVDLVSV